MELGRSGSFLGCVNAIHVTDSTTNILSIHLILEWCHWGSPVLAFLRISIGRQEGTHCNVETSRYRCRAQNNTKLNPVVVAFHLSVTQTFTALLFFNRGSYAR